MTFSLKHRFAAGLLILVLLFSTCGCTLNYADNNLKTSYSSENLPDFDGETAYIPLNNNVPEFTENDLTDKSFESYSQLDSLGRCGTAIASVGVDIMPTEERGAIGQIKPTGWHTVKYDIVDGKYLYNRCHLIGYQLTGENANEQNLITGTRFLNIEGMLPFENMVADYVKETENHVLYRVTPYFEGNNLVANGVQIEAMSVEDNGKSICFNIYAYNAQPGVSINYVNGDSKLGKNAVFDTTSVAKAKREYVLNTNSMKIHTLECGSVKSLSSANKKTVYASIDELIKQGYTPCMRCNPQN